MGEAAVAHRGCADRIGTAVLSTPDPPTDDLVLADSATQLGPECEGRIVVCGSHGGRYAAALLARAGVRACVVNDAGIGLRRAGVAGLELLAEQGIPAAAVDHESARIGHAADTLERGVVSESNSVAKALGCTRGMGARAAVARLADAPPRRTDRPASVIEPEARYLLRERPPRVWGLDSASLVRPADAGSVLMIGSHGGLVGGNDEAALRVDAIAAVFNDAGDAPDGAGTTRLAVLDRRGIAAATVAASTAEIGDGRSTYLEGVLSTANAAAARLGAVPGMPARRFAELI